MGNWMSWKSQDRLDGSRAAKGRTMSLSPTRGRVVKAKSRLPKRANSVPSALQRRGKAYGSVKLRTKSRKATNIFNQSNPWSSDEMDPATEPVGKRKSEIRERDNFLELLSKVQDSRYNSQRYTLKAGSVTDEGNLDEVFEEKSEGGTRLNGAIANGKSGIFTSKRSKDDIPVVEITDSPSSIPRRIKKAASVGSVSGLSEDSRSPDEARPSSAGSKTGREVESPLSPTQSLTMESVMSPSRKSSEALKKILGDTHGPYPLLIEPPDGDYWVENGDYEAAKGEDGVWRAPEISTEHYTLQADKTAFVYGRYFRKQDHQNYIGRDHKQGPVIISLKLEEDYQGTLARVLIRTQKETIFKILPSSQLPSKKLEPEDFVKIASLGELNVDKVLLVPSPKVSEQLQKFDEHPMAKTHKFGVIYQQFGQTCEEELFGNIEHPESLAEFLDMLGDKVDLKGFEGYRGGLDVTHNQTGECSVYTEFKDRKIMFHVSTLLPHDQGDTQYVQKKRHIGNDIVVIVFQDANTPFCPNMIRSHFVHSYIVVQVEHPNTDHTVYKVAVTAKNEVPDFGPPLPDPAIFQKGAEFRDWLLMKALNAEFNCHQAPSFKKLATRTRNQLFVHLVEDIAQTLEEVDGAFLSKELTSSLDRGSPDVNQISRFKKRRRTLTGMFGKKTDSPYNSPHLGNPSASAKRKSLSSPKILRKVSHAEPFLQMGRRKFSGSTPDLMEETEEGSTLSLVQSCNETKKDKTTKGRKLPFKKQDTGKEKEKRKPKRTASVHIVDFRVKNLSPRRRRTTRHDSSGESSIASGMNLGGSIPFDLPGTVEAAAGKSILVDNGLLGDRRASSTLTLEEIGISISPKTPTYVDAAIQCSSNNSSHYTASPSNSPRLASKGEHAKRLHSVSQIINDPNNPLRTQSLPSSPLKNRRSSGQKGNSNSRGAQSPPLPFMLEHSRRLYTNQMLTQGSTTSSRTPGGPNENGVFYRVESVESIGHETDEMYATLLQSLDSASSETARLREYNFNLLRENVKFASQNRELKNKYLLMKQQLFEAQEQIRALESKLQQCQSPTSLASVSSLPLTQD